ncbi:MAG: hypothetical protein Q9190_005455 [Brigantiaea leucoxantha]
MSQYFNNTNQNTTGYSHNDNYAQTWTSAAGWPVASADSYSSDLPSQNQVKDNNAYFEDQQQELIGYDENDDFYDEEQDPRTDVDGAGKRPESQTNSNQVQELSAGSTIRLEKSQISSKTSEETAIPKHRNEIATSANMKTDTNGLLAELRAKVVAARRGKSITPAPSIPNGRNEQEAVSTALEPKADGVQQRTIASQPAPLILDKSSIKPQAPSNISVANTDLEGLFAEARAAEAAKKSRVTGQLGSDHGRNQQSEKTLISPRLVTTKSYENITGSFDSRRRSQESIESGEISNDPAPSNAVASKQTIAPADVTPDTRNAMGVAKASDEAGGRARSPIVVNLPKASEPLSKHVNSKPTKNANRVPSNSAPSSVRDPAFSSRRSDLRVETASGAQNDDNQLSEANRTRANPKNDFANRRTGADREKEDDSRSAIRKENERAAAQYKKELESRARQESESHARRVQASRISDANIPKPAPTIPQSVEGTQKPNSLNGLLPSSQPTSSLNQSHFTENLEDVIDWLENTGFYDVEYRDKSLTRFRRIKELQRQQAELEREAELEFQSRRPFVRSSSSSVLHNASIEAKRSLVPPSPSVTQQPTTFPMDPPRILPQDDGDVGIKIKNMANRDTDYAGSRRPSNSVSNSDGRASASLKRQQHDDLDVRNGQPPEKVPRVRSGDYSYNMNQPISPVTDRLPSSRSSRDEHSTAHIHRFRSRSPRYRQRSASPIDRHFLDLDAHTRQDLRVRPQRGHSVDEHGTEPRSKTEVLDTRGNVTEPRCRDCGRIGHFTSECMVGPRTFEMDHQDSNHPADRYDEPRGYETAHPHTGYQSYQTNSHHARGRGGRGNHTTLTRNSYKPSKSYGAKINGAVKGGESLDLKDGG